MASLLNHRLLKSMLSILAMVGPDSFGDGLEPILLQEPSQAEVDVEEDHGAFEDHACVHLHTGGAGPDLLVGGLRRVDATAADDRNLTLCCGIDLLHGSRAPCSKRFAAQTSLANLLGCGFSCLSELDVAISCCVGDDEAVDGARRHRGRNDFLELCLTLVGQRRRRELHEDGGKRFLALRLHLLLLRLDGSQQFCQGLRVLECLTLGGVGAGDVEDDEVAVRGESREAGYEVLHGCGTHDVRTVSLRDVDTDGSPCRLTGDRSRGGSQDLVVLHPSSDGLRA
eukprot:CAMPEP_0206515170 /NCGR_PEP_ID=MMETSP0324_2-20121206/62604_1 /ASSEMBLY_ACC=CAM_ASM_000836 /TAXON_ID=2866 /ORGANISM="Crypthecodinium cohnii, Strain Seligo" /LENGTH=282 /DNA_ID=CAMNT_0054007845 /DNA_START=819 /DNA_END=1667 /DNA_ORIENTATION=-